MKLALQLNRSPEEAVVYWQQVKDFFTTATGNLQAATQEFQETSSKTSLVAIASSVTNWLQYHPVIFRIFNTILWAIDRPIISFIILILIMAITFSIVKGLNRLLEMLGLSLLKAPFKLIKSGLRLGLLAIKQKFIHKNTSDLALTNPNIITSQNPHQRLAEISQQLQKLQKEQNELLQEAAIILSLNKQS